LWEERGKTGKYREERNVMICYDDGIACGFMHKKMKEIVD